VIHELLTTTSGVQIEAITVVKTYHGCNSYPLGTTASEPYVEDKDMQTIFVFGGQDLQDLQTTDNLCVFEVSKKTQKMTVRVAVNENMSRSIVIQSTPVQEGVIPCP